MLAQAQEPWAECQLGGGWTHRRASLSVVSLAMEWPWKYLTSVLLSDVTFLLGWDCWLEKGRSRALGDIPVQAASLFQTSFSDCSRDR